MNGYDIIGDVHGCATVLDDLLVKLGYRPDDRTGVYRHPARRAVFVGDLVDRGPDQRRVLELVKPMVDDGSAYIVMGNHEFNAIGYATEDPRTAGVYLREHSEKNTKQHRAFLAQLGDAERAHYVEWFQTLPLWLDLGDIRVVHACWHPQSIEIVERELGSNRFSSASQFARASTRGNPLHDAVEVLLKGPEIDLTKHGQPPFIDWGGDLRNEARVRWWDDSAASLRDIAELGGDFTTEDGDPYPALPETAVPEDYRSFVYTDDVPVFYGHYWRDGSPTHRQDWTGRTACVDFSAAKPGGVLVAYRWSGESEIRAENYVRQR
ncbi:metallophosphoesterase [Mycobacterium sp. ACS1612]|uniref:metallophosphoesterase n=1 Tax=Mycobacterium sp. ACS1612 TaxID=1834117 RepID=UPI000ACC0FD8